MTFQLIDEHGVILTAGRCNRGHACVLVTTTHGRMAACVTDDEIPRLATGLYEQAGLEAPLMLTRMPMDHGERWRSWSGSNLALTRHGADIRLECSGAHELSAGTARQLASALATFAEGADEEPDAATVKALLPVLIEAGVFDAVELARKLARNNVRMGGAS